MRVHYAVFHFDNFLGLPFCAAFSGGAVIARGVE